MSEACVGRKDRKKVRREGQGTRVWSWKGVEKWGNGETMFKERTIENIKVQGWITSKRKMGSHDPRAGQVTGTEPQMTDCDQYAISGLGPTKKNKVERRAGEWTRRLDRGFIGTYSQIEL
jgi:hypothetical protein